MLKGKKLNAEGSIKAALSFKQSALGFQHSAKHLLYSHPHIKK